MNVHHNLLLMSKVFIHLLSLHLRLELLSDLLCILLLLEHLENKSLFGLLGAESSLTAHGVSALLLGGDLLASILLHLLLKYRLHDQPVLSLLEQLELLELGGLIHVHLVLIKRLLVDVLVLLQLGLKPAPRLLQGRVVGLRVRLADEHSFVLLEIEWGVVLEGLEELLLLQIALGELLVEARLLEGVQLLILLLSELAAFLRLYQGNSVLQVILHLLPDLGPGCVHSVTVGKWEVGDGLLIHPVVVLSVNCLFTLGFYHVYV